MAIFSIFFLVSLLLLSIYFYYCYLSNSSQRRKSGFKNYPIFGSLPELVINRNRFYEWTTQILSDCPTHTSIFHRPGNINGVITANPANVEHILKANFENHPKGELFIFVLQDFLGKGIFNSDGETWRMQRKTASYEFNTKSLRIFIMENVRTELHSRLIPILSESAKSDRILDLQDVLERFAFDNICKLAFNFDADCLGGGSGKTGAEFMKAFDDGAVLSSGRFMYVVPGLWLVKKFLNFGSEKALKKSISIVHEFADTIIRKRLEESKEGNKEEDLLSRFIGKGENSPEYIRDIIISFILAGRDTTSSALSWFFWILSFHPQVENKILKELEEIRLKNCKQIGDSYSIEELRDMNYLHAAISESMRLYPPVPVDTKACLNDTVLPDGTFIKKGWSITYHTYAMGRMRDIWGEDCCEFRPERWMDDEKGVVRQESPFRYPVFHGGPRMCLGKDMAYIQMKSIAAAVMERFAVEMAEDKSPEYVLSLTLRMKGGLAVRMKERSS